MQYHCTFVLTFGQAFATRQVRCGVAVKRVCHVAQGHSAVRGGERSKWCSITRIHGEVGVAQTRRGLRAGH